MENSKSKTSELVKSAKSTKNGKPEVTLEQLESLCYSFSARPRGCTTYTSTGDNDDVLF
jgi:hypothetical protein